ncbi:MAG: DNA-binding CsgD family transcriptional regulator [Candidatus Aldehydirespiratoraceae bacterium]|jgi:DNA-binding CsgD family transcriptional regulator
MPIDGTPVVAQAEDLPSLMAAVDEHRPDVVITGFTDRQLTPRESEVLGLIAEGLKNAGIASRLVLSEKAVEIHINSIFSKLQLGDERDTHRRVRAVLLWLAGEIARVAWLGVGADEAAEERGHLFAGDGVRR